MPGLMTTFVDVGLNDKLAEALSRKPGFEWAAWDSYRRFLQSWAMASGIDRDVFDDIMIEFKARYGVERKLGLPARAHAGDGLRLQGPRPRAGRAVTPTTPSARWWPASARCSAPGIPPRPSCTGATWGSPRSGARPWWSSGWCSATSAANRGRESPSPATRWSRTATRCGCSATSPPAARARTWWAAWCSPGPSPRPSGWAAPPTAGSSIRWRRTIPEVYQALLEVARDLVGKREHDPQEIEFTFESDIGQGPLHPAEAGHGAGADQGLPVLRHLARGASAPPWPWAWAWPAAPTRAGWPSTSSRSTGLLAEKPGDPIVLLRPDTVPEDIAMITRVSGLLTARGGATSHAAVTAKRLGKTAVVDCRALEVRRAPGHGPPGRARAQGGRLALHRRPDREHLPGPHPDHRPGAVAAGRQRRRAAVGARAGDVGHCAVPCW